MWGAPASIYDDNRREIGNVFDRPEHTEAPRQAPAPVASVEVTRAKIIADGNWLTNHTIAPEELQQLGEANPLGPERFEAYKKEFARKQAGPERTKAPPKAPVLPVAPVEEIRKNILTDRDWMTQHTIAPEELEQLGSANPLDPRALEAYKKEYAEKHGGVKVFQDFDMYGRHLATLNADAQRGGLIPGGLALGLYNNPQDDRVGPSSASGVAPEEMLQRTEKQELKYADQWKHVGEVLRKLQDSIQDDFQIAGAVIDYVTDLELRLSSRHPEQEHRFARALILYGPDNIPEFRWARLHDLAEKLFGAKPDLDGVNALEAMRAYARELDRMQPPKTDAEAARGEMFVGTLEAHRLDIFDLAGKHNSVHVGENLKRLSQLGGGDARNKYGNYGELAGGHGRPTARHKRRVSKRRIRSGKCVNPPVAPVLGVADSKGARYANNPGAGSAVELEYAPLGVSRPGTRPWRISACGGRRYRVEPLAQRSDCSGDGETPPADENPSSRRGPHLRGGGGGHPPECGREARERDSAIGTLGVGHDPGVGRGHTGRAGARLQRQRGGSGGSQLGAPEAAGRAAGGAAHGYGR